MSVGVLAAGPVLVTGVSGQLGGALHRTLGERGVQVIGASRSEGDADLLLDLGDTNAVARAVRELDPAVVINAAAFTAVDAAETEVAQALRINADAPQALAKGCRECGALLVQISTDYVFDGNTQRPYRESDPANPINVYGRSKLRGEQAVASSGAAHLIVRTSGLYAPGGRNFVATMLRLFAGAGPVRVVADQFTAPTCAIHLADALLDALVQIDVERARGLHELVHLSARGEASWFEFASAIRELGGGPSPAALEPISSEEFAAAAPRPARSTLDSSGSQRVLQVSLPHWRDQLADVIDAFAD